MRLERAREIAELAMQELAPWCERIEIAGSIRRRKAEVGDVELVCIPKQVRALDLFEGSREERHPSFVKTVEEWRRVKGWPRGRYTQRMLPEGIALDLFMARPQNWGLIFAVRTGSAAFSHSVLAMGWCRKGWESCEGMLWNQRSGGPATAERRPIEVREEKELFELIGVDWVEPEKRG